MCRKLVVPLTALAVLAIALPAQGQQERPRTVFEKALDLLAPKPRAQRAALRAQVVADPNPANLKIQKLREDRLKAHLHALADWIDAECSLSPEQREKLQGIISETIGRSQKGWLRRRNVGGANGDRDFIPFEFITVVRPMTQTGQFRTEIEQLLTNEQLSQYQAAMRERDDSLARGLTGFALVILDQELFLRPEQREPVQSELQRMLGQQLYAGLFSFTANGWPFQRAQFRLAPGLEKVLGPVRLARYKRLTANKGQAEQYVMITLNGGESGIAQFQAAAEEQPGRLAEAMAVRIAWLAAEHNLSEAQQRKLQIAAKGAAARTIDAWITSSEKQLDSMRERFANQNVSWGMSLPQVSAVESQSLWRNTLDRMLEAPGEPEPAAETTKQAQARQLRDLLKGVVAEVVPQTKRRTLAKPSTEREKFRRAAMVDYVIAILDEEIWLHADQRKHLRALVDESLADFSWYYRYLSSYSELQLLVDALYAPDQEAVRDLLSPKQFEAWTTLRGQFVVDKNMVKLTYRHGEVQFPRGSGRRNQR